MATSDEVANIIPVILSILTDTVNVSAPSVVKSAEGVTEKVPKSLLMVKLPELVSKSDALDTVQYSVVPFGIFVVDTLKDTELPSATSISRADISTVGVRLVSLIVTSLLVDLIGPEIPPVLTDTVKVSGPSVEKSEDTVTEKLPALELTTKLPDDSVRSPLAEVQ